MPRTLKEIGDDLWGTKEAAFYQNLLQELDHIFVISTESVVRTEVVVLYMALRSKISSLVKQSQDDCDQLYHQIDNKTQVVEYKRQQRYLDTK